MVDLGEIQAAYYMVAATGVLVAAGYYILNMRETMKNRRATFSMNALQSYLSELGQLQGMELASMQWSDFEDFKRKYDSSVNPGNYAKRAVVWNTCEVIGYLYRTGVLDINTISIVGGQEIQFQWGKFKSIIEEYRKWQFPSDKYENFEFLANVLHKMHERKDAEYNRKFDTQLSTHIKRTSQ